MDKLLNKNINLINAFSRLIFQIFLIIDPHKDEIAFVSQKFYDVFYDLESEKPSGRIGVKKFFANFATAESLKLFNEVYASLTDFFREHSEDAKLDYIFECGLIRKFNASQLCFSMALTPFPVSDGETFYLCVMSVPTATKLRVPKIWIANTYTAYYYNFKTHKWNAFCFKPLTTTEKIILTLSAQGFTLNEISSILIKSVETVKTSRRKIFQKLGVDNIQQASMFALNHNII